MKILSDIEKLAQESRDTAIRTAITLFRLPKEYPVDLITVLIDSIITAAMMEISAMQIKMVEEAKK